MKPDAIYLDMDGVLVDLVGGVFRLYGAQHTAHPRQVKTWDGISKAIAAALEIDLTEAELWERVAAEGESFWANLDWLPWGQDVYEQCNAVAPIVLMSTPNAPLCAAGKITWIRKHIPKLHQKRYALSPCKHHMAHPGALLIDDGQHNVDAFRAHGGTALLFPAPWNSAGFWPDAAVVEYLVRQALA